MGIFLWCFLWLSSPWRFNWKSIDQNLILVPWRESSLVKSILFHILNDILLKNWIYEIFPCISSLLFRELSTEISRPPKWPIIIRKIVRSEWLAHTSYSRRSFLLTHYRSIPQRYVRLFLMGNSRWNTMSLLLKACLSLMIIVVIMTVTIVVNT